MKIDIVKTYFPTEDGKLNLEESLLLSGRFAGVCYDKEGYNHLKDEPIKKTKNRINLTKNNGHHSVYDHIQISFNITNIPKMLAMVLNNEKEYTTSEKSARYTPVTRTENSIITELEEFLYNKWLNILQIKIKEKYGYIHDERKILKLAQENARYLVTVFMPTTMIYTTSLRQINYIISWMQKSIKEHNLYDYFEHTLANYMHDFIIEMEKLNVLDPGLLRNEKNRSISLFGSNLDQREIYFGEVYSTYYKGTIAQLAQTHRHRTIYYQMERTQDKEYIIPDIIKDDNNLVEEWLNDMRKVKNLFPQGELVSIYERGNYENFILKCEERLCSAAQLEIMQQTQKTLLEYQKALIAKNSYLANDIEKYTHGARCTFPDFVCPEPCGFKEGITLKRKI